MKSNASIIVGIYNHCDTWCERCLFTSQCRSFQLQSETGLVRPFEMGGDMVQQLTDALNLTKQYIDRLAGNQEPAGPDAPDSAQIRSLEEEPVYQNRCPDYPVSVLASRYLKQTGIWLTREKNLLAQTGQQKLQAVELGLQTEQEVMPVLHALKDAWEMIRWYRALIPVKIQAVLRSLTDPTDNDALNAYHLGKAKLVLVSIDRSMLAWQTMLACYPEKTDDLIDILALLVRLRREMETQFPDAWAFKRPGLD